MNYNFSKIASIIDGTRLLEDSGEQVIEHLLLDSRKLLFPATSIFFALNGARRHGHQFIPDLYQKGVRSFVVDTSFDASDLTLPGANVLQVPATLDALQHLVKHHRKQFSIPVIGITGSNGKTIVKEWLYQLLQPDFTIVRSARSYNSQIGVPLSVWQMNETHTLAIFEAGISRPGEMQQLEPVIQPTIGVFTNIGEAHAEGFMSLEQKAAEKWKLFSQTPWLVYPSAYTAISTVGDENVKRKKGSTITGAFRWGIQTGDAFQIISIIKEANQTVIAAKRAQGEKVLQVSIPFIDDASIENAITCWCVLLQLEVPEEAITLRMRQLRSVEMRLELKQGINNCSVINDSYSADINSLAIALDFLVQQQQHPSRTLILSDILESGKSATELYSEVAAILEQKQINRLIGIGSEIAMHAELFTSISNRKFFSSLADFKQEFFGLHFHNETILLKGARKYEFEQISHLLEQKVHQTVLEINLNALTHNLQKYQQLLQPGVKLMAMVKAFSYGSGGYEIANLLQFNKVDYLGVAYADEGVELRRAGITLPILVLNPEEATYDVMVAHNLEPEMYSMESFTGFQQYLEQSGITDYPVHLKLDTGMHRLGFELHDLPTVVNLLNETRVYKVQSVFSHLAASDAPGHDAFTTQQARLFEQGCQVLQRDLPYPFIKHIANTSAVHRHPHLQFDMVRLGIGLYGIDANEAIQQQLMNVSTLKTTISQVKQVAAGESVGYSRKGVVKRDSQIATVRIGYADGYPRVLSNGVGFMWVKGSRAPVIGNVCMDMTMLDITGLDAREGDEVIVFGDALPVALLAGWAGTIPYEILTGISQRVKRVYFEE